MQKIIKQSRKYIAQAADGARQLKDVNKLQNKDSAAARTINGNWPTVEELNCFFLWSFRFLTNFITEFKNEKKLNKIFNSKESFSMLYMHSEEDTEEKSWLC